MGQAHTELLEKIKAKDARTLAKLISRIEREDPEVCSLVGDIYRSGQRAQVIGFTGPPGAGKSTLVDRLAMFLAAQDKSIAIIAVDPSSPFTGGALLGDRIRMNDAAEHSHIYLRSMASRGALGGLSQAVFGVVTLLGAAGYDYVLIETVGVGQAEVDIVRIADTCVVTLVPGLGDTVQLIKAGIIEIGDIFAVNKADREGAMALEKELLTVLALGDHTAESWLPTIQPTVATEGKGIAELAAKLTAHREWLEKGGQREKKQREMFKHFFLASLVDRVSRELFLNHGPFFSEQVERCVRHEADPFSSLELMWRQLHGAEKPS